MAIDATRLDPEFKYEVASRPGAENVKACFTCGVCTAGCPVSEVDERYSPRRLIRMIVLGLKEELLSGELIWLCNTCYDCYAHCPQNVKFTDVISVLREMAVEEGYVDEDWLVRIDEIDQLTQRVRNKLIDDLFSEEGAEMKEQKSDLCPEDAVSLLKEMLERGGEES